MAAAASIANTTDLITCPICLDVFDNPKSLPCLHGFCLKCLQQHFKDKSPGHKAPCPLCRKEFKIPPGVLVGLQQHFLLQHLIDAKNALAMSSAVVPCGNCLVELNGNVGAIPRAIVHCSDCNTKLCENCSRQHRRMIGKPHRVIPLGDQPEPELFKSQRSYCEKHTDEQLKLYCCTCDENVCILCLAGQHKNHIATGLEDAAKSKSEQIDSDAQNVWKQVAGLQEKSASQQKRRHEFARSLSRIVNEIKEAGSSMSQIVKKQESMHLAYLELVQTDDTKRAEKLQVTYKLALAARENFHAYSRELLDKGRPSDITRAATELHKMATELLADDVTSGQYSPTHLTFTPVDVSQLTGINLVGEIMTENGQRITGSTSVSVSVDRLLEQNAETQNSLRRQVSKLKQGINDSTENEKKLQLDRDQLLKQLTERYIITSKLKTSLSENTKLKNL